MTPSRPFKEDRLALSLPSLSPPGDRWCDALGFVHLKHLNTPGTPRIDPLGRVALPAGVLISSVIPLQLVVSRAVHPKEYNTIKYNCIVSM